MSFFQSSNNKQLQSPNKNNKLINEKWTLILSIVILIITTSVTNFKSSKNNQYYNNIIEPNSIYAPGSGLAGAFYTVGRLGSMKDLSSKHIYCYSSGCYAAAVVLNNNTVAEAMEFATNARDKFMSGQIAFHEFNDVILDNLLYSAHKQDSDNSTRTIWGDEFESIASRIHIITTTVSSNGSWFFGTSLKTVVRTPTNLDELREMLKQTAWVPFMTGNSLMHEGHMDGGFDILGHPKCEYEIKIPYDSRIWMNTFNFNIDTARAESLWEIGYNDDSLAVNIDEDVVLQH